MTIGLLILFAALQLADTLTTLAILDRGGCELNPLMRGLFDDLGAPFALVLTKSGLVILAVFGLADAPWIVAALCLFYVGVVINNLLVMRRL